MTVDYIFEFLTGLLDGFIGSDYLLIVSMLIPCLAIFGFITIYALIVIYAELKVSSLAGMLLPNAANNWPLSLTIKLSPNRIEKLLSISLALSKLTSNIFTDNATCLERRSICLRS